MSLIYIMQRCGKMSSKVDLVILNDIIPSHIIYDTAFSKQRLENGKWKRSGLK